MSATAQAAQERLKSAEARVEAAKRNLGEAEHALAVLRDPWAGLKPGECRLYESGGKTFARAIINGSFGGKWVLEVVK